METKHINSALYVNIMITMYKRMGEKVNHYCKLVINIFFGVIAIITTLMIIKMIIIIINNINNNNDNNDK